jgi:hypothetical protein
MVCVWTCLGTQTTDSRYKGALKSKVDNFCKSFQAIHAPPFTNLYTIATHESIPEISVFE